LGSRTIIEYSSEETPVSLDDTTRLYGGAGYKVDLQTRPEMETLIERVLPCLCSAASYRRFAVNSIQPNPDEPEPKFSKSWICFKSL
jgi:hypothetical protein